MTALFTLQVREHGEIDLPELAADFTRLLAEGGAELPDLLAGLRIERQRLYDERWRSHLESLDRPQA